MTQLGEWCCSSAGTGAAWSQSTTRTDADMNTEAVIRRAIIDVSDAALANAVAHIDRAETLVASWDAEAAGAVWCDVRQEAVNRMVAAGMSDAEIESDIRTMVTNARLGDRRHNQS